MDKVTIDMVAEETVTDELVELGAVSEETRGGFFGWPDGGTGFCYC